MIRNAPILLLLALSGCLYFGPGQSVQAGEKTYYGNNNCLFYEQGFDCGATRAFAENGRAYLDLRLVNRHGRPLTIKKISCVYGSDENAYAHASQVEAALAANQDYENNGLACVDSSGNYAPAYPDFRGKLVIWYNYPDDLDQSIPHVATASMLSS